MITSSIYGTGQRLLLTLQQDEWTMQGSGGDDAEHMPSNEYVKDSEPTLIDIDRMSGGMSLSGSSLSSLIEKEEDTELKMESKQFNCNNNGLRNSRERRKRNQKPAGRDGTLRKSWQATE